MKKNRPIGIFGAMVILCAVVITCVPKPDAEPVVVGGVVAAGGNDGKDVAWDVAAAPDGRVVVVGTVRSSLAVFGERVVTTYLKSFPDSTTWKGEGFVALMNPDGTFAWAKSLRCGTELNATAVTIQGDLNAEGRIWVAGTFKGTWQIDYGAGRQESRPCASDGDYCFFLASLDASGELEHVESWEPSGAMEYVTTDPENVRRVNGLAATEDAVFIAGLFDDETFAYGYYVDWGHFTRYINDTGLPGPAYNLHGSAGVAVGPRDQQVYFVGNTGYGTMDIYLEPYSYSMNVYSKSYYPGPDASVKKTAAYVVRLTPESFNIWSGGSFYPVARDIQILTSSQTVAARDVAVDDDGAVYVVGSFVDEIKLGNRDSSPVIVQQPGRQAFAVKLTADLLSATWAKASAEEGHTEATGVHASAKLGVCVSVNRWEKSVGQVGITTSRRGKPDALQWNLHPSDGTTFWVQQLGGTGDQRAHGVSGHDKCFAVGRHEGTTLLHPGAGEQSVKSYTNGGLFVWWDR